MAYYNLSAGTAPSIYLTKRPKTLQSCKLFRRFFQSLPRAPKSFQTGIDKCRNIMQNMNRGGIFMKKLTALMLSIAVLAALCAPAHAAGLDNFQKVNTYTDGQFTDVSASNWYAENVRAAYEYGIMTGSTGSFFNAAGNLSVAETIVMACRLHNIYHGTDASFEGGSPWYQPYVDYAKKQGILTRGYDSYSAAVSRADFAVILGASLPDEALPEIGSIEEGAVPDVAAGSNCYEAVYRLYRAGILTGNDAKGTFTPAASITRGAAAAIISRLVDPALRKSITLEKAPFEPVPMEQLANLSSLRKKATDAELAQAYEAAREIVTPLAGLSLEDQLYGVAEALREMFDSGMDYSMSSPHYNDPYGYFVLGAASCAGCTRATGLCLNMLGIPYEHVNENQYSHQWCRVNVNGTYWICDAYGLYCGPEPAPYTHPYLA